MSKLQILRVANMFFNAFRAHKILAKISEFTVKLCLDHEYAPLSFSYIGICCMIREVLTDTNIVNFKLLKTLSRWKQTSRETCKRFRCFHVNR